MYCITYLSGNGYLDKCYNNIVFHTLESANKYLLTIAKEGKYKFKSNKAWRYDDLGYREELSLSTVKVFTE